jgi:hypothetical protein
MPLTANVPFAYRATDAYQSYNALTEIARDNGPWQLVYCWTHVRRRNAQRFENEGSPIAEAMLRQIALLYRVEKTVRGKDAAVRLTARREHSAPIIAALKPWLEAQLSRIPQKSQLAEDIYYPAVAACSDESALHLGALARPDQIPQRRHPRDGYQPGREPDQADCPHEKKCTLRGQ